MIKRSGNYELLHEVVEHNGILYFAGLVTEDTKLGIAGQTASVLEQLDQLLKANGSSRDRLLTALLFITDLSLKPAMNKVWKDWLSQDHLPTRATIGISDLGPGILLEAVFTAAKG